MFDATFKISVSGGDLVALGIVGLFAAIIVAGVFIVVKAMNDSGLGDEIDDDDPADDDQPSASTSATPAGP